MAMPPSGGRFAGSLMDARLAEVPFQVGFLFFELLGVFSFSPRGRRRGLH